MVFSRSFGQGTIERPFGKAAVEKSIAQGTIEYLVIMAIVIVIGLLVVGLSANFINPAKGVSVGIGGLKNMTSGSIIVVDAVSDLEGDGLVILKGLPGENNVITKITVCGVDSDYASTTLVDQGNFALSIPEGCVCSDPGEVSVLSAVIYYTTLSGLNKSVVVETSFDCVGDVNNDVSGVTQPEVGGNVVPVVLLMSPVDGSSTIDGNVSFVFVVNDSDGTISGCSLNVTGLMDANSIVSPDEDVNVTLSYELDVGVYDWNVSCVDNNADTTTSSTRSLTISSGPAAFSCESTLEFHDGNGAVLDPYQICDWNHLNNMRSHLTSNYILLVDLNSDTNNYSGIGDDWVPIGTYGQGDGIGFSGSFDGNSKTISDLKINRLSTNAVGLVGFADGATITTLDLIDIDVNGSSYTGGLIGIASGGTVVSKVSANGSVRGLTAAVGGLIGSTLVATISNSYTTGAVYGETGSVGGLAGRLNITSVSNSYSTAAVSSPQNNVGGLFGWVAGGGTISNSYSTGTVSGALNVGGFIGYNDGHTISNCGWYESAGPLNAVGTPAGNIDYNVADVSSFYSQSHGVYTDWNFDTIWQENGSDYPTLR